MHNILEFPNDKKYNFTPLIDFIFNDYGDTGALPEILDTAIKQITLSENDNGTETISLLFGLRDAFTKISNPTIRDVGGF